MSEMTAAERMAELQELAAELTIQVPPPGELVQRFLLCMAVAAGAVMAELKAITGPERAAIGEDLDAIRDTAAELGAGLAAVRQQHETLAAGVETLRAELEALRAAAQTPPAA